MKALQHFQWQLRQIAVVAGSGFHGVGHSLVGIAGGLAFFHQVVGQVGGSGKAFFGCIFHGLCVDGDAAFFFACRWVDLAAHHFAEDAQRVFERIHRVKQRLFVFLVVFVVGQWLAFHQGDEAHQMAHDTPSFAACEFGHVWVFLLRHDGAAGGEAVSNFDEAKVLAHPQNQLFRHAADVHHAQAGGGGEFNREVAVAHAVQAVLADLCVAVFIDHAQCAGHAFVVQRVGGASQSGTAQRQAVGAAAHVAHPLGIACKHFHVGQQVVGKAHGLGHLQVGEAGQDDFDVFLSHFHE